MKSRYEHWHKSSRSAPDGECVEVSGSSGGVIGVRDTKQQGSGPILEFSHQEWAASLQVIRAGRKPS